MTVRTAPASASDAALISQTRLGDDAAYATLAARHSPALVRLAHVFQDDPDTVVGETLATARAALRLRQGPRAWLRGYLLQVASRQHATGIGVGPLPAVQPAFGGLAEAWQAALWHRLVEHESPADVAAVVGVAQSGVIPVVTSAQEELRRAVLTRRWAQDLPAPCRAHLRRLLVVRPGVPPRAILRHATVCTGCSLLVEQLEALEAHLPEVLARHVLGPLGRPYLEVRRSVRV